MYERHFHLHLKLYLTKAASQFRVCSLKSIDLQYNLKWIHPDYWSWSKIYRIMKLFYYWFCPCLLSPVDCVAQSHKWHLHNIFFIPQFHKLWNKLTKSLFVLLLPPGLSWKWGYFSFWLNKDEKKIYNCFCLRCGETWNPVIVTHTSICNAFLTNL